MQTSNPCKWNVELDTVSSTVYRIENAKDSSGNKYQTFTQNSAITRYY